MTICTPWCKLVFQYSHFTPTSWLPFITKMANLSSTRYSLVLFKVSHTLVELYNQSPHHLRTHGMNENLQSEQLSLLKTKAGLIWYREAKVVKLWMRNGMKCIFLCQPVYRRHVYAKNSLKCYTPSGNKKNCERWLFWQPRKVGSYA